MIMLALALVSSAPVAAPAPRSVDEIHETMQQAITVCAVMWERDETAASLTEYMDRVGMSDEDRVIMSNVCIAYGKGIVAGLKKAATL